MDHVEERRAIAQAAERVRTRFPDVPADAVDEVVARLHHEYAGRPIRDFVPVLVERDAIDHFRSTGPSLRMQSSA